MFGLLKGSSRDPRPVIGWQKSVRRPSVGDIGALRALFLIRDKSGFVKKSGTGTNWTNFGYFGRPFSVDAEMISNFLPPGVVKIDQNHCRVLIGQNKENHSRTGQSALGKTITKNKSRIKERLLTIGVCNFYSTLTALYLN